jgi:hypothetical protein
MKRLHRRWTYSKSKSSEEITCLRAQRDPDNQVHKGKYQSSKPLKTKKYSKVEEVKSSGGGAKKTVILVVERSLDH